MTPFRDSGPITRSPRTGWASRKSRRRVGYRVGLVAAVAFLAIFAAAEDNRVLAKGPANPGHGELDCRDCHDPAPGSLRQQIQAGVAYGLGLREEPPEFGLLPVSNRVCLDCHERQVDHHPTHNFLQPKFAEARRQIAAHLCITCHREHTGRHVTGTGRYCVACHDGMSIRNDPLLPTHAELASESRWETCLRCHDFHGNHVRSTPRTLEESLDESLVLQHLERGGPEYGEIREVASPERMLR